MVRESIRQIVDAQSGPELVGASRLARALNSHADAGFDDLLVRHAPDLVEGAGQQPAAVGRSRVRRTNSAKGYGAKG
ncbi:hypothetical protein BV133_1213 [Blastochloris viridis]|nr:hypothetical protein BV133_1213 [Blastochloris viridis]